MTVESEETSIAHIMEIIDKLPVSRSVAKKAEKDIPRAAEDNANKAAAVEPTIEELCDNFNIEDQQVPISPITKDLREHNINPAKQVSYACPVSPISLIHQVAQQARDAPPLIWEEFGRNGLFGCRLHWGNLTWITPAQYARKKEARNMVAVMACIEILGNKFIFEHTDPKKYESWTKQSVRAMCNELLEQEETVSKEEHIPVTCAAGEDPQKPFVAIVNEECQKRRLPLPNYECFGETCGGIMKFRCRVSGLSLMRIHRSVPQRMKLPSAFTNGC